MLKTCGESVLKPLKLIFKSCMESRKFPIEWEKANVVPVHKKNDKQLKENYCLISLLPICSKILERLIYNKMFEFFTGNELISFHQSGFKPGDSCTNHYVLLTIFINLSMTASRQELSFLTYISKAFDKVWHEGVIYKLKQNGISGHLLNIIKDSLSLRKQRVVLNG